MQIKDNIKNRLENNFLIVLLSEFFNKKLAVINEKPNKKPPTIISSLKKETILSGFGLL